MNRLVHRRVLEAATSAGMMAIRALRGRLEIAAFSFAKARTHSPERSDLYANATPHAYRLQVMCMADVPTSDVGNGPVGVSGYPHGTSNTQSSTKPPQH
jgi:hypothetical protein